MHVRAKYGSIREAPPAVVSKLAKHAKRCGARIKDYDSKPKRTFAGTNLEGNEQIIRSHIRFLIQDLANKGARTRAPTLRQACRIILRTYSDLYYNVLSAQSPWEDCWHARHRGDILAGSTDSKTATGFMQDRYTWISMRNEIDDQHHDLTQAIEAIQNSDKPARAALLLRDNKTIRKLPSKQLGSASTS